MEFENLPEKRQLRFHNLYFVFDSNCTYTYIIPLARSRKPISSNPSLVFRSFSPSYGRRRLLRLITVLTNINSIVYPSLYNNFSFIFANPYFEYRFFVFSDKYRLVDEACLPLTMITQFWKYVFSCKKLIIL